MNIFMETEDYMKGLSIDSIIESDTEFFTILKRIRERLGVKQYLLDRYVKNTLEAINFRSAYECAEAGEDKSATLRRLCIKVLDGQCDESHPMYSAIKNEMEKYRTVFQERGTLCAIVFTIVFPDYLKLVTQQFIEVETNDKLFGVDVLRQQELFNIISGIVGEQEMECLNFAIKRRFLIVPAINNFLQGLSNEYLDSFLRRDEETERHVFQILLDEGSEV